MTMVRAALLSNFIPPYRLPLFEALAERLGELRIFLSVEMESNRDWTPDFGALDVTMSRSLSLARQSRHPAGFVQGREIHVPYGLLPDLGRYRPDIIISSELGPRTIFAAIYCLLARVPLIIWATLSERTEEGVGAIRTWVRRRLLRRAGCVLVNGSSGRRYVTGLGVAASRVVLAPYTAVPEWESAVAVERPRPDHLLFVGQLISRKGLEPFLGELAAVAQMHSEKTVRLVVAGEGPLRGALQRRSWPPNLSVEFLGHQDPEFLSGLLARSRALAFPTLADEWGVVVNEALASGVPVLGSIHSQAVDELIQDGWNGWTFDPEVPESMRRALERLLSTDEHVWSQMSDAARSSVAHLTPGAIAHRIAAAVADLCERTTE